MSGITRPMSQMRKIETKEAVFRARKRIIRYLVLAYLKQERCVQTAETFFTEAGLTGEYEVCDNIDLDIILQDYCSYYLMRFNKQPQFCKKVEDVRPTSKQGQARRTPSRIGAAITEACPRDSPEADLPSTFVIKRLLENETGVLDNDNIIPTIDTKPLSGFLTTVGADNKQLAELLYQDIIKPPAVSWEDIKGLDNAKSLLMESVVYPAKYPDVFTGLLEPWRGVLLHGAPGTGKTMLAKAVANESNCTFFNVSCSTMVNKWRGESEKIVKILFEMANYYAPSIIFVDEVESLVSDRAAAGEHEASRRFKAQLLTELDGICGRDGVVFLLANSNMPWEIDSAMLRRLEKRIYIPLPDFKSRVKLFEMYLNTKSVELNTKIDYEMLATNTVGYSGSDIKLVCKEALMATVRNMLPSMKSNQSLKRRDKLDVQHLLTAISKTKPVSKNLADKHVQWQNEMGCS